MPFPALPDAYTLHWSATGALHHTCMQVWAHDAQGHWVVQRNKMLGGGSPTSNQSIKVYIDGPSQLTSSKYTPVHTQLSM